MQQQNQPQMHGGLAQNRGLPEYSEYDNASDYQQSLHGGNTYGQQRQLEFQPVTQDYTSVSHQWEDSRRQSHNEKKTVYW